MSGCNWFTLTILFLPLSTTAPPDTPEGVEATPESASVRVSWQTVDDADRYIVTFSQVQGTDGLQCHSDSHTASLTVDGGSSTTVSIDVAGDVESTVTDMLRAYTRYTFTVTAVSDRRGTSQPSTAMETLTPQTSEDCVYHSLSMWIKVYVCHLQVLLLHLLM